MSIVTGSKVYNGREVWRAGLQDCSLQGHRHKGEPNSFNHKGH